MSASKERSPDVDSTVGDLLVSYLEPSRSRPTFSRHATVDSAPHSRRSPDTAHGGFKLLAPGLTAQDLTLALEGIPSSRVHSPFPQNDGLLQELKNTKREVEVLKSLDPFRVADMAIEIQVERLKLADATSARDSAVQRLSSAYDSIKEKAITINRLQKDKCELESRVKEVETRMQHAIDEARADERQAVTDETRLLKAQIDSLKEALNQHKSEVFGVDLRSEATLVASASEESTGSRRSNTPEGKDQSLTIAEDKGNMRCSSRSQSGTYFIDQDMSTTCTSSRDPYKTGVTGSNSPVYPEEPLTLERKRFALLASLPVPPSAPDDALRPIMIPSPFTIHEFLGNTTGSLRSSLQGYRAFYDKTTRWCPDNEEHGYFLSPVFKCTTSPKVSTAHCWAQVDPSGRMNKPTECFYCHEGMWYYAGQYITIRMDDLSAAEWEALDTDVTNLIVKETLAGRKNMSAQNCHEVSQLYACGALKVACIGLQCVGFNSTLYGTIIEQATRCQQNGRRRSTWNDFDSDPGAADSLLPSSLFSSP